jgi:lysophospholipase L1-like esterase
MLAGGFLVLGRAFSSDGHAENAVTRHIVLLGDSVFDNGAYVRPEADVRQQLIDILPQDAQATLLARDGAVIADVASQIRRLPATLTHLVISIGGNDALRASGLLEERAESMREALEKLAEVQDRFRRGYAEMIEAVAKNGVPAAFCTIYEPRFPDARRRRVAATALAVLNDVITRLAFSAGITLIDLRSICDQDEDFANPIEPSMIGGAKIAEAITRFAAGGVSSRVIGRT